MKSILVLLTFCVFPVFVHAQTATEYFDKFIASQKRNDLTGAIYYLDRAIELDPDNWNYYRKRSEAYLKLKRNDEAVSDLNRSIFLLKEQSKTQPHLKGSYQASFFSKGSLYEKINNYDSAVAAFTSFYEADTGHRDAWVGIRRRAKLKRDNGDFAESIQDYELLAKIHPAELPDWFFAIARLKVELGEFESAIEFYTRAIESSSETKLLYYFHRAGTYTRMKDYESALKEYDNILKLDPSNENALYYKERIMNILRRSN